MKREIKKDLQERFPGINVQSIDIEKTKTGSGKVKVHVSYLGDFSPVVVELALGPSGFGYADIAYAKKLDMP